MDKCPICGSGLEKRTVGNHVYVTCSRYWCNYLKKLEREHNV